ncbi:MAG TPA: DHHA1 domain-containing protein [Acidobacteriaceae bacterium]|jgi:alanyl-tRNA synthetase|nr:DHHA1 domain-containing protein [Acidobacteriaceae bacterium]
MSIAERLYYKDSFLRCFTAVVTDVRELASSQGESVWQLAFDRTAFYPDSGGQPCDSGLIRATSPGGVTLEIPVESVEEDEHGQVWHVTRKPLSTGTHIEGELAWERRFDHMQQHTGQHLLSAVFLRELNAFTVSFHLGEKSSTIDLTGTPLAQHSLERIERVANELIAEDRAVSVRCVTRDEAESMLANGALRKLPDRSGDLRLIEIAGIEDNACGGTHVRSTGQIGGMLLRGAEKVSRGVRVEFVCGLRAIQTARADAAILAKATASLSVGTPDIPAAIERLKTEVKNGAKERMDLREHLADYHAARLAVEVPITEGLRLVDRVWKDRDAGYVKLLATRLTTAAPSSVAIFCSESGGTVSLYFARSLDLSFDCGRILKDTLSQLGLRGGGSADLAQGEVPSAQAPALRASLADAVHAAIARPS